MIELMTGYKAANRQRNNVATLIMSCCTFVGIRIYNKYVLVIFSFVFLKIKYDSNQINQRNYFFFISSINHSTIKSKENKNLITLFSFSIPSKVDDFMEYFHRFSSVVMT